MSRLLRRAGLRRGARHADPDRFDAAALKVHHRREQLDNLPGPILGFVAVSVGDVVGVRLVQNERSEEHTSELQSLMRISYAVFCLKKKTTSKTTNEPALKTKQRRKDIKKK